MSQTSAPGWCKVTNNNGIDADGFSHLILLYHFHQTGSTKLTVTPFLDNQPHGVFATRARTRPNPIGLSLVRLIRRDQNILHIANLDILDGVPLLDMKPSVPAFDGADDARVGWLEKAGEEVQKKRADNRFG